MRRWFAALAAGLFLPTLALADGSGSYTLNDGQVLLEGVPPIPAGLAGRVAPYQDLPSTEFLEWARDGRGVFVKSRLDGVGQIHLVSEPGGAWRALTFRDQPVGEVVRQPGGRLLAYTMGSDGDGADQIYLLDPDTGESRLLTDGKSLNNRMAWDRGGRRLAWRSTRRDGRHNDVWVMDIDDPPGARPVLEVEDGALWKPVAFSPDGDRLLLQFFASVDDSRVYLLDLKSGALRLLLGDAAATSSNIASGFDADGSGVHFVTNQRHNAAEAGWVGLSGDRPVEYMPQNIIWEVSEFELSPDGARGAFVTNEEGISKLYLYDPAKRRHKQVRRLPVGVISGLRFSPDGRQLGMTLSSPQTPSDAYSLALGKRPLNYGRATRWTHGEAEGLDLDDFADPALIHYPSPLGEGDRLLMVPAFYYKPAGGKWPRPVIIYLHGGPEGQYRPAFNSTFQMWLDQLGTAVIAPNVRGSLGYGATYLTLDDGLMRENAVRDIGALLDWIDARPDLDQRRVALVGASYGGYLALATAMQFGDRVKAVIDRAGISHFVNYLESTEDYRRDLRRVEYGDERDPAIRAFLESISPLNGVDRIVAPVLVAQGKNDPVVPESESLNLVRALRKHDRTVWFMNALNEGHAFARKENQDLYEQVSFLFLQRYLLGD